MKPLLNFGFHALHLGLLRAASLMAPAEQRAEWRREWHGELWHVCHSCVSIGGFSWQVQREVTAFCFGSFADAVCLRRQERQFVAASPALPVFIHGSASQCVLWLSIVLALCALFAQLLPGVRAENDTARYRVNPGLIFTDPKVSSAQFLDWKSTSQRYFDSLAFYRTTRENVSTPAMHAVAWHVAHGSANLFNVLGLPVEFTAASDESNQDLPAVLLSHQAWTRDFGANPRVTGRLIRIGGHAARIAGVVRYASWRLPSNPDAWLLERDSQLAADVPSTGLGYVIAHLTPLGKSVMYGDSVTITTRGDENQNVYLRGTTFDDRYQGPRSGFSFALFLALFTLPAVISVSMSESNFNSHRPSWKRRFYRYLFLGAKAVLVASIGYFASLDIAYGYATTYSPVAEFVQFVTSFTICLFGLRWALVDQSRRCPVCLRRVTHPARVGLVSQTFLGWNGMEMMCLGGHTLLHVPSLPTSWFSAQRWLYLDTSWEFLFAAPRVG